MGPQSVIMVFPLDHTTGSGNGVGNMAPEPQVILQVGMDYN